MSSVLPITQTASQERQGVQPFLHMAVAATISGQGLAWQAPPASYDGLVRNFIAVGMRLGVTLPRQNYGCSVKWGQAVTRNIQAYRHPLAPVWPSAPTTYLVYYML